MIYSINLPPTRQAHSQDERGSNIKKNGLVLTL